MAAFPGNIGKTVRGCRYALRSGRGATIDSAKTEENSTKRPRLDHAPKKGKQPKVASREASMDATPTHTSTQSAAVKDEETCRKYLLKSEPSVYSILDLENEPDQTTHWDGVRNYQARNIMKEMQIGDLCFFYHSNAKPTSIVGIVRVTKEAYPDHTSWETDSKGHDPTSTADNPKWFMVDVQLVRKLEHPISLTELKEFKDNELKQMPLLVNSRLSVQPVNQKHWDFVLSQEQQKQ